MILDFLFIIIAPLDKKMFSKLKKLYIKYILKRANIDPDFPFFYARNSFIHHEPILLTTSFLIEALKMLTQKSKEYLFDGEICFILDAEFSFLNLLIGDFTWVKILSSNGKIGWIILDIPQKGVK